jgi:hypothetical protein
LLTLLGEGAFRSPLWNSRYTHSARINAAARESRRMVRAAWRAISKPGSLRGIYFKIDEFFRDLFQQVLAGLGYRII